MRPDEGNLETKLCGISEMDRQALLQDVLSSGCADPNYPPIYWGNPAMHATFEGDLDALETLRLNGCDLRQKFEWVLQEGASFSLVHAAAFNGQEAVLRYLRTLYPPSFMREIDATGTRPSVDHAASGPSHTPSPHLPPFPPHTLTPPLTCLRLQRAARDA